MQDFKHMHHSNKPATPKQPTILEYIGAAFILCSTIYGVMYFTLIQATGGF